MCKGAAKQLLVAVQSSPLIPDEELGLCLKRFGVVKKMVRKFHDFNHNHQIYSELRCIILHLNEDVETKDIPGFVTTSDLPEANPALHQDIETPSKINEVEQNDAAPGQPIAQ